MLHPALESPFVDVGFRTKLKAALCCHPSIKKRQWSGTR
jgi:hypothetical protein